MATPARSDFYTNSDLLSVIYSDFVLDFSTSPITGYLGEVINEVAVAQMMQCLVLTPRGSWPFEPQNGSTVASSLFDPNDQFAVSALTVSIQNVFANYAPQVNITGIQVNVPLAQPDTVQILIGFQIQSLPGIYSTVINVLRRLR